MRFWTILLLLPSLAQAAPSDQLVFTGKRGPADAFSAGSDTVHLRWGVTEGELPADLIGFEVRRGDDVVFETPARPRPTAAQVTATYADFPRHRQLAAGRLTRAGVRGSLADVTATRITQRTAENRHWVRLAGRLDPVLAQLAGRGVILPRGASGTYTLYGRAINGARALLGTVNIDARNRPAQPPQNLRAVQVDRCDAPEQARQHGVLAFDWDLPGAEGEISRFAYVLDTAGYDLYRTIDTPEGDVIDFAAAAARAPLDAAGAPRIDGVMRLSDAPLSPVPSAERDRRYAAWNPAFAQWFMPAADVARSGLKPGDRRTLYVVPRDVTGNYGVAARLVFTVPDALAPPAPRGIRAEPIQGAEADSMRLRWWHIEPRNLIDAQPDKTWCNLETAVAQKRLVFAGRDGNCARPAGTLNAAVDGYIIYRFDNQVDAAGFTDTDGDGVADADERVHLANNRSLPGTACDPNAQPDAPNYRVATVRAAEAQVEGGHAVLHFADPLGDTLRKGVQYWYRVAAIGENGRISPLSIPVRAVFPDLERPPRLTPDAVTFGECGLRAYEAVPDAAYAIDETGRAATAEFYCADEVIIPPQPGDVGAQTRPIQRLMATAPIEPLPDGRRGTRIANVCERFLPDCELTVIFRDDARRVLGSTRIEDIGEDVPLGGHQNTCDFTARLVEDCSDPQPVAEGETVLGRLIFGFRPEAVPPKACVELSRTIGGRTTRLTTFCGAGDTWLSELAPLSGVLACYAIATIGTNGVTGTSTPVGCVRSAETGPPAPPTITRMQFAEQTLRVGWRSAPQDTGGIFLEWRHVDGATVGTRFISHAGRFGGSLAHDAAIDIPAIGDGPEHWCLRARSVGRGQDPTGEVSDWSSDQCAERLPPDSEPPTFLGWPNIPAVPQTGTLAARFLVSERRLAVALSDLDGPALTGCRPGDPQDTIPPLFQCGGEFVSCGGDVARLFKNCDACGEINAALGDNRRFVAYRQRRHPDGRLDPYVQVSPRIDRMYCTASCNDPFGCQDPENDPYFFCAQRQNAEEICEEGPAPHGVFDPYLKLLAFNIDDPWPQVTVAFVDRSPFALGSDYRYQFVYFDGRDEISGRKITPWVTTAVEAP